jgi:nitroreductase
MSASFDFEAEVRDLAARRDIHDALCRYMRAQDRLDRVLHLSAFHADAFVDCGLMAGTPAEFVEFAQGFLDQLEGSQHLIGQVQLDIRGDAASGEVYFYAWHRVPGEAPQDLFIAGRYVDEYTCRNGEWRIQKRREIIDWVRSDPVTEGSFYADNPTVPRGGQRGADFSQTRDWQNVKPRRYAV